MKVYLWEATARSFPHMCRKEDNPSGIAWPVEVSEEFYAEFEATFKKYRALCEELSELDAPRKWAERLWGRQEETRVAQRNLEEAEQGLRREEGRGNTPCPPCAECASERRCNSPAKGAGLGCVWWRLR